MDEREEKITSQPDTEDYDELGNISRGTSNGKEVDTESGSEDGGEGNSW